MIESGADEVVRMFSESDSSSKRSSWQLWRQDDNGVSVLVTEYAEQESALKALAQLESHHHKQTYWIVENKSGILAPEPK